MTRRALIFVILGLILLFAGTGLIIKAMLFSDSGSPAALQVNSFPKADVYVNDARVGQTPYSTDKLTSGDYTVKLVASANGQSLSWIGKVKLTANTLTYINRELGIDNDSSAGEILSLEHLVSGNRGEISIISDPSGAQVKLDGQDSGQTPLTVKDLSSADHEIALSLPGYKERFIHGRTMEGFRLDVAVQLAKATALPATVSATPAATSSAQTGNGPAKPYVVIKETGTGWLRVRVTPSISATEAAKVNTGEKLPYVDAQPGWVEIKYQGESTGWVSDAFVTVVK